MKIVFKGNNFVKMYGGEITYDNLVSFIKSNYPEIESFTLSFQDEDGDSVTVASQTDVDTMKEIYDNKEIIRIDVSSTSASKT